MTKEHKYKVGDRFVVEVKQLPMSSDGLYYLCDGNTFYPEKVLETLPQFPNGEDSNDLYMLTQEEKSVIEERAYNKGRNDIWELVEEISTKNSSELLKIFSCSNLRSVLDRYSPKDAKEAMEEYELSKITINVGDVCKFGTNEEVDVYVTMGTGNTKESAYVEGFYLTGKNKGHIGRFDTKELRKTEDHIDIDDILLKARL